MNVTTQISPISTLQMHIITKFNCYNRWMFMRFLCLKTDPVTSDSNYWLLGLGRARLVRREEAARCPLT